MVCKIRRSVVQRSYVGSQRIFRDRDRQFFDVPRRCVRQIDFDLFVLGYDDFPNGIFRRDCNTAFFIVPNSRAYDYGNCGNYRDFNRFSLALAGMAGLCAMGIR
jgi:hypothetical protein